MVGEVPVARLNDGAVMPRIGLGTSRSVGAELSRVVVAAVAAGYRKFDTAASYGNEAELAAAVAAAGLSRSEVFYTTKVWNDHHGRDAALRSVDASLERLGTDHVDLLLIHWPVPSKDRYVETWRALEEARADGRATSIGVSNFQIGHLERLAAETGTVPAVNQVELHPLLTQAKLRAYHDEHGIVTEAWSPLDRARSLMSEPVLIDMAERYGAGVAAVILAWHLRLGNSVIPKSTDPRRLADNLAAARLRLAEADVDAVSALNQDVRHGPDPDERA